MAAARQKKLNDFFNSRSAHRSNEMSISAHLRQETKEKKENASNSDSAVISLPKKRSSSPKSRSPSVKQSKKAVSEHSYATTDFGTCPICNKSIPLYRIDHHLDAGECDPKKDDSPKLAKFPVGLKIIPNFVSLEVIVFCPFFSSDFF